MKGAETTDAETKRTEIALFRYGLLAPILHRELARGELLAHLHQVAASHHQIPFSARLTVSFKTLWRWLVAYRKLGFDGLKPRPRRDEGTPRRVPQEFIDRAIALRQEVPSRSAATIVEIPSLRSGQALARDPSLPRVKVSTLRSFLGRTGGPGL